MCHGWQHRPTDGLHEMGYVLAGMIRGSCIVCAHEIGSTSCFYKMFFGGNVFFECGAASGLPGSTASAARSRPRGIDGGYGLLPVWQMLWMGTQLAFSAGVFLWLE